MVTKKLLQEFVKNNKPNWSIKIPFTEISLIWEHMEANKVPGSTIEMDLIEETVKWMIENKYKTFSDYEKAYEDSRAIMAKATSLDRRETSNEDLRKKLGYSNAQWKIIIGLEKSMATELKKLIVEYMASAVVNNKKLDDEALYNDKFFKELDLRWRNFSRSYLIPNYPGANKNSDLRTRITGLFSTKLLEAVKKTE